MMSKWIVGILFFYSLSALAFPGFFVSKKSDQPVFNKNSKIFFSKLNSQVNMTIFLDYMTTSSDFALVLPFPSSIDSSKIKFLKTEDLQSLETFTSPYLEVVPDSFNCSAEQKTKNDQKTKPQIISLSNLTSSSPTEKFNFEILDIKENHGFNKWLENKKYYLGQSLRFELTNSLNHFSNFLVITLKKPSVNKYTYLNPIQISYDSKYLSVPLQIGSINSPDFQRSWLYILTQNARMEVSNYRTMKRPTDLILPEFTISLFDKTYNDLTLNQPQSTSLKSFHLEFTGPIRNCADCDIPTPTAEELSRLGVQWANSAKGTPVKATNSKISPNKFLAYVTRLYVNYSSHIFNTPIAFLETKDQTPFHTFFNIIKPTAELKTCNSPQYFEELKTRHKQEAQNLANITGWPLKEIEKKLKSSLEKSNN